MLDSVIESLTPLFADWGLLIVFVATFLESGTFVASIVPGETILLLGGFFASSQAVANVEGFAGQAPLEVSHVIAVAFCGALLGDMLGYAIGRVAGRALVRRFGRFFFLPEHRLPLLERYVSRYGARAMFFGRFAPFLRSVRTLVAGIARMSFTRFAVPNVAGAFAWTTAIVIVGYLLGESWRAAQRYLGAGGLVVFVLLISLFLLTWRSAKRRFEREMLEGDPAVSGGAEGAAAAAEGRTELPAEPPPPAPEGRPPPPPPPPGP